MKKQHCNKYTFIIFTVLFSLLNYKCVAQTDSAEAVPVVKIRYFNDNNRVQYLLLQSQLKKGKVFTPQTNKIYEIYLSSSNETSIIAKVQTDQSGLAKTIIPPGLKNTWDASAIHTFIVKEGQEEIITDYAITKSKIELDTSSADGVRSITATVMKWENNEWTPAKDVEMKLGIKRLGGILSAGDDATYTTDSSGSVTAELKKDSLPGDLKGNIILLAKVEDNDLFGNLQVEKTVPWGKKLQVNTTFFEQRTLWSTRFRTPFWLLAIAYSIVIGVWGTIIYLLMQLVKIKKLGKIQT
jgi:hypothetical protein